jgi:hypothetical protein
VYGILGEDDSDSQTLKVLVRRLAGDASLRVKAKGFSGCGEMLDKGARQLQLFRDLSLTKFGSSDESARNRGLRRKIKQQKEYRCLFSVAVARENVGQRRGTGTSSCAVNSRGFPRVRFRRMNQNQERPGANSGPPGKTGSAAGLPEEFPDSRKN